MVNILIDGIHLGSEMKGVGLYVANILKHISIFNSSIKYFVIVLDGTPDYILPLNDNIKYIHVPWRNHLWHGFRTVPKYTMQLKADVVFVPYEIPIKKLKKPYLMLCHDIPRELRAAHKCGKNHYRVMGLRTKYMKNCILNLIDDILLARTLQGAEIVFCNSNYVGGWIEKEIKVDPLKIHYAPCAPGAAFNRLSQDVDIKRVREMLGTPDGYILVFHTGDPRENFGVVPEIYQRIVDAGFPHKLVVAGVKDCIRTYVDSFLSKFPWRKRVKIVPFLTSGKEQGLAEIYTAASLYLDTSFTEGFGMQVVEAMACKTAVVCSNRGALPEVASDAALLVNPEDIDEVFSAISKILSDHKLTEQLISHGYKRSKRFSWEQTARTIYNGLIAISKSD